MVAVVSLIDGVVEAESRLYDDIESMMRFETNVSFLPTSKKKKVDCQMKQ